MLEPPSGAQRCGRTGSLDRETQVLHLEMESAFWSIWVQRGLKFGVMVHFRLTDQSLMLVLCQMRNLVSIT